MQIVLHYNQNVLITNYYQVKMKKNLTALTALLLMLLAGNALFAQSKDGGFNDVQGANFLNAGIGLGSYGLAGSGLPLTATFEHGFSKNISAGVGLGFIQTKVTDYWKYTYLMIGARGSYHLNEALNISNTKIDVYGGAGLFYRHYKWKDTFGYADEPSGWNNSGSAGDVVFDLHAGARYMFGNSVGAYAELGYGISPLQLGVSLKF